MQPGPQDPYNQQPPGNYPPGGGPPPGSGAPQNVQGLVGMILGIVAIPLACCGWGGLLFGAAGAVLGFLGKQKADQGLATNRGQAMAGLICGVIGAVLGIIVIVLSFTANAIDWQQYVNNNN